MNAYSILSQYEYDDFGRPSKIINAVGDITFFNYDDAYITEWGQKAHKCTQIDPIGNQTEEIFDLDNHLIKQIKKDHLGNQDACKVRDK